MLKNLKVFLSIFAPYKGKVWLALIIGSVSGAATGGGLVKGVEFLFTKIFDSEKSLTNPEIALIAAGFPGLFIIIGAATFGSGYLLNLAGLSALRDIRQRLFDHLQHLPLAFFQSSKTGDLISRITADTQMIQMTLNFIARNVIAQPAIILGSLYYLGNAASGNEGVLKVYLCLITLPIVIFPIRIFSRKLQKKARAQQGELGELTNNIVQNLGAIREVKAFNLQERESGRFRKRVGDLLHIQMKVIKYTYVLGPIVEVLSSLGLSIAFVIAYQQGVNGGVFAAIFLALYLMYTAVKKLGAFSGELYKGVGALSRIEEILEQPITIQDPEKPVPLEQSKGDIEFHNVSFSYGDTPALSNANARIQKGDICALVGPSGAGKSTFANLVARFYDVSEGQLTIDGTDIRSVSQQDLRDQIAIVSQDPVLFDDTILENIRLGKQDATDEEVQQAAEQAFAHDFISDPATCPDGYNTITGERGARLSGGQKQRIAIARAFLRNAPILILDEATSALDSESESKIQKALETLVSGKTVLIIAHRFSTIKNASQILVFEDGKIIDDGNHSDLHARCPLYKKLYDQQSS